MSKILVTGGCGFIGSHLVDILVIKGYQVIVVDDFSTGKNRNQNARTYRASITNFLRLKQIIGKEMPDKIVHLAAKARVQPSITNPLGYNESNVTGTLNVFEAARTCGIKKVVFASSSSVMFGSGKVPYVENNSVSPTSPYSLTKYIDELYAALYCDLYGLETIGLRFFNVYGPRMTKGPYKTVITIFAEQIKKNIPLTIVEDGSQKRDFTHVSDIVDGILKALYADGLGGEVINLGRSHSVSVNDIASLMAGTNYPREYGHLRIGEPTETLSNIHKARRLLGWEPKVNIEKGLKEILSEEGIAKK